MMYASEKAIQVNAKSVPQKRNTVGVKKKKCLIPIDTGRVLSTYVADSGVAFEGLSAGVML